MRKNDLKGKRVLLRVDFNVPVKGKRVMDNFRILSHIPTIKLLMRAGAQVFLITHLDADGRTPHLGFMRSKLEKILRTKICFISGAVTSSPRKVREKIAFFDNVRLNTGEKKNDSKFARALAKWGDIFINDAFSVSHRKHASIVGLPKLLPSRAGLLMEAEIKNLTRSFNPPRPFFFVLAGKKFSTKEPLINKFVKKADKVFVGGALANAFLEQKGVNVGRSYREKTKISPKVLNNKKIVLPDDFDVQNNIIYDAGPKTIAKLAGIARDSKFVLWNGTLGFCEKGFSFGTREFAKALGRSRAYKIVGGGDTVAAIRSFKLEKNFNFISTGGGAMLEFLAKGTLPGIEELKRSKKFTKQK